MSSELSFVLLLLRVFGFTSYVLTTTLTAEGDPALSYRPIERGAGLLHQHTAVAGLRGFDTVQAHLDRHGLALRSGWGWRWMATSPVIGIALLWWIAGECRAYWEGA